MRIKGLFIAILLFVSFGFKCGDSGGSSGGEGNIPQPSFTGKMECSKHVTSPKGVQICSGNSISNNVPAIVDQQLDDLFKIAGNGQTNSSGTNNYHACPNGGFDGTRTCFSTHATYYVWLIPRAPACVNPGFTENADGSGYDETYSDDPANHWDKDPRPGHTLLCVAGFMAVGGGKGLPAEQAIGLPGMAVVDAVDQMPIVRYEGEHNLLVQVDPNRYAATQYHYGNNGGHPILGDGPVAGLIKRTEFPDEPNPVVIGDQKVLLTK